LNNNFARFPNSAVDAICNAIDWHAGERARNSRAPPLEGPVFSPRNSLFLFWVAASDSAIGQREPLNLLYIFDKYVLDPNRRELRVGATLVAMEPQVFDLLLHLVRHREHVVSRDELIESVWGGRIVSESALSTRITAVRSVIGDNGTEQRLIKTLPRKGVRFVGDVREECSTPAATPPISSESRIIDAERGR
jgi:DNA-binding winged helix-turn-helix (wHTH) protein